MNSKLQFNSLRTRLTFWFLTVTMLSLAAVATIVYFQRASVISEREFEKLQVVRDLKVAKLSSWIDQRVGDLEVASGDGEIQVLEEIFKNNGSESDPTTISTARSLLQRYLDHYNAYDELFIVSASSGKVAISTDLTHEGRDKKEDLDFTEPMRTGKPYIKDIYYSETDRAPAMAFSSPIFCLAHDGEHPIGVLVARINLEQSLFPLLQERTGMGKTGETLIVNKNGVALNALRWHQDAALKLTISAAPAVKAAGGETGIVESGDYRGEQVLAAYTHIPQTGWGFVAKRDLVEVYAPIRAMLRSMMLAATAVILFVIAVSLLITRSISRPILAVTNATARMASGDSNIRTDVRTGDEIEVLATAFNNMADRLDEAHAASAAEDWIKTGITNLDDIMRGEKDLSTLCRDIITDLARYLDIQVGALFISNPEQTRLVLSGSYAYKGGMGSEQEFQFGEGLIGQTAQGKTRIMITDVPEERITVITALGEIVPSHILCIPLLHESEVKGVVELGSLQAFTDQHMAFLEQTGERIASVIHSAQLSEKMKALLEESQSLSEELQTQQEELRTSNEELEVQTQALQQSEEELKSQQEELQTTNEELEEKTCDLGRQKNDLTTAAAELEEKAAELTRNSKYKSEFLANMSHELRTPLNSLLILSGTLAENDENNLTESQIESAQVINESGNALLALINEILDLSKIEAGQMTLHIEPVPVEKLAADIQRNFRHVFEKKGLTLHIHIEPDAPPQITSDPARIGQILKNLLSNAVKFTARGSVSVDFAPGQLHQQPCLSIAIQDTGTGIPANKQKLIFEAFQQADGGTARKYGGTGLGLSISRELVRILGGAIDMESEEGKGSIFRVHLPFDAGKADGSQDAPRISNTNKSHSGTLVSEDRPASPTKLTNPVFGVVPDDRENSAKGDTVVLVVEDDTAFAKLLLNQCHQKKLKALVATTGEESIYLAEKFRPNAVILDLVLPGIDGWAVLDHLKNNMETRHIPVHIMSVEETSHRALNNGAIGFLQKPADPSGLQDAFDRIEDAIQRDMKELLVIEDDDTLRKAILQLIGNGDVHSRGAGSGKEALEMLRAGKYDCIILDLNLPDMTGFQLLETIESSENIVLPPVIIYTGRELSREEETALVKYSESIIIKGVRSQERLFDEVSLFLHRMVEKMPEKNRQMIANLHDSDIMFQNKKVLIVDDDMRNLFALSNALAAKGIQPIKAQDGQKALDMLAAEPSIELVLMDIMMPGMDGYETMTRIRAQDSLKNLPIIALTAKAMKDDRRKCIEAGANDYMAKPVDINRLFSLMRVWMYR